MREELNKDFLLTPAYEYAFISNILYSIILVLPCTPLPNKICIQPIPIIILLCIMRSVLLSMQMDFITIKH